MTVLFIQQPPLTWPASRYGYLLATDYGVMGVALLLLLPIMSETFGLSDLTIVNIYIYF